MKGIMKKSIALALTAAMLSATGCGSNGSEGGSSAAEGSASGSAQETRSADFTYLLGTGVSTIFYDEYQDNPVMQYYLDMEWDADGDGQGRKITIDFYTPPTGSENDYVNTLVSTGEYPDIMSMTFSSESAGEMYEDGMILDITDYVEQYMPNYLAYLDRHPELKDRVTNLVDGEKRYIQIYSVDETKPDAWGGFMYRRDWIVKYGANPETGEAFSGEWVDGEWVDDVVFPSGNVDPMYISDWEWMLDIFADALNAQNVEDGYAMSLYYTGQPATGDLSCAFGGGGTSWYIDKETGDIAFGTDSEGFRTYLECMSTWYANGWIDKAFSERSNDMFFMVDTASVYSGKVGLWYGTLGSLGSAMDSSQGDETSLTYGMVVYAAPQPINDVYGSDEVKNKEPYTYYSNSLLGQGLVFTDKCADKDLPTLFTALDYLYSEEGALLKTYGFSDTQQAQLQNEWYNEWGLTEGAYSVVETEDGISHVRAEVLRNDSQDLTSACNLVRMNGLTDNSKIDYGYPEYMEHGLELWGMYDNSGLIGNEILSQLTPDEQNMASMLQTNINTYTAQAVPEFIIGERDIWDDAQWQQFCEDIYEFQPETYTAALQRVLKGE